MNTSTLFDELVGPPAPDPDRTEPVLWIRKLQVIDSLSVEHKLVREVEFRRGLNIINTAVHPGDPDIPTVGHSVGKSLLVRLIRYCLGESSFSDKGVRQSICDLLPGGYVIGELVLEGKAWFVARPIGLAASASASWATDDEVEALFDKDKRVEYRDFQTELSSSLVDRMPTITLPHARRSIKWNDIVGWLSPDQACAHKSHVEWRPGGTESANRGLKIEDNHIVIRAVMDILTESDAGLIGKHKQLLRDQGTTSHSRELEKAIADSLYRRLKDNKLVKADGTGELFADRVENDAKESREALGRLLDEEQQDDPVNEWLEKHNELQKKVGATETKLERETSDRDLAKTQLDSLESGDDELDQHAEQGEWCHLFISKEDALASGCPGVGDGDPGAVNPRLEKQKADLRETIRAANEKINELEEALSKLKGDSETSENELEKARDKVNRTQKPLKEKIESYRRLESDARRYRDSVIEINKLTRQLETLKKRIKSSLKSRKKADERYQKHRQSLSQHFQYAVSELLGQSTDGSIEINANGIFPRTGSDGRTKGEALGTSAVLAFDLGCLASSIGGLGYHPRIIIHDSPRDADMEEPLYHRLFEHVASLENIYGRGKKPSFQYIITTTTSPPEEMDATDFIRLTLDARQEKTHLLKKRF